MSDYRDPLERERRRFTLGDDAFERLVERRARRQRRRRLAAAVVALVVAAAGVGGGVWAVQATGDRGRPAGDPTETPNPNPTACFQSPATAEPSPCTPPTSPSPSAGPSTGVPPAEGRAPAVSGPIQFVDDLHGWMVDADGQILSTADGGHTWEVQLSGSSSVTAVDAAVDLLGDGVRGWALFNGGLLQTSDGGAQWVTWSNQALSTVQFLTPNLGWGVEATDQPVGRLLKTVDAGRTWVPPDHEIPVNSVCFADETHGWAAGPSEGGISLFHTDDGGATWTEAGIGMPGGDATGYRAEVRCGGIDAWVVASGGGAAGHVAYALFRTAEGGAPEPVLQDSFTHPLGQDQGIPEATNPYPGPLAVLSGLEAGLVTWCPPCGGDLPFVSLETTGDGGASWSHPTVVGSNQPGEPLGISFLDQDRGWILLRDVLTESDRIVLRTTDGGRTRETP